MFVQVIQAKVKDPEGLQKQWQKWRENLKPQAQGYLGGTAGVTDDGRFVAVARFESQEVAKRNSDAPQQGEWWSETEQYLEDPKFVDCTDVQEWLGGGSDDAGFVQVIEGSSQDDRDMTPEDEEQVRKTRPDVIGGISAKHPDANVWTTVAYFTDESAAREGENSPEFQAAMQESGQTPEQNTYWDLKNPWLDSA